eukprot:m51a1_g9426 putative glutamate dehydrogenase (959) ;mRNA; r:391052-394716
MLTKEACKAWLLEHMPASFKTDVPEAELDMLAHTLVLQENFEEHVYLNFGSLHSLVITLDHERADEEILKHYGSTRLGLPMYHTYVANACLAGHSRPLRVSRLDFDELADRDDVFPTPEDCGVQLRRDALENDAIQHRFFTTAGKTTLVFAWKNVQRRNFLHRLVAMFRRYKLRVTGMRFSYSKPLSTQCVLLGMIHLEGAVCNDDYQMHRVRRELELLKNFRGNDALEPLVESDVITGNQANLLRALTSLVSQILSDVDVSLYTEENVMEAFASQASLTLDLLRIFETKFLPRKHDMQLHAALVPEFEAKLASMDTGRARVDDRRRAVFGQALNVVRHVVRTNMYETGKLGIAFRLDPAYLDCVPGLDRAARYPEMPYGIYYIKGWNFFGFHVRFRDLARGGMRTVAPWDREHELSERPNMFGECYNLALTQQKKNKDIPEGGSKSIVFLASNDELPEEEALVANEARIQGASEQAVAEAVARFRGEQRTEYMYYNQRCFLQTFLKLLVWDFERGRLRYVEHTIDHLRAPEYVYLGPDENFHDCMIEWLARESVRLGYYAGGAFISGKERAGINHKEYGVTSWGCLQYLHHCVRHMGYDRFTVKMTGGPDGDVAGNFLLLLRRYYGARASVVAITDGSGTSYDPEGLCLDALEAMFHKGQMMHDYPAERLHEGGWILCMRRTRQPTPLTRECLVLRSSGGAVAEEWVGFSQANHTWATNAHSTRADVFLPCGGRPRSLNMGNVGTFVVDGRPTSDVIVEGANLYTTAEAREYLEDLGVLIIRDSSANKCGVISSSYEILAGLSMTDEQFVEVKQQLAQNILARLEAVANDEAKCMMDYWLKHEKKIRMTKISEMVSAKINKYTDDIAEYLKGVDLSAAENKYLLDVFINYVPECIRANHLKRCLKRVPDMHKKAVIATKIACSLVYGRGLDYEPSVVDCLPFILPTMRLVPELPSYF